MTSNTILIDFECILNGIIVTCCWPGQARLGWLTSLTSLAFKYSIACNYKEFPIILCHYFEFRYTFQVDVSVYNADLKWMAEDRRKNIQIPPLPLSVLFISDHLQLRRRVILSWRNSSTIWIKIPTGRKTPHKYSYLTLLNLMLSQGDVLYLYSHPFWFWES